MGEVKRVVATEQDNVIYLLIPPASQTRPRLSLGIRVAIAFDRVRFHPVVREWLVRLQAMSLSVGFMALLVGVMFVAYKAKSSAGIDLIPNAHASDFIPFLK